MKVLPHEITVLLLGWLAWSPEKCCMSELSACVCTVLHKSCKLRSTWQKKINIPYSDSHCRCVARYHLQSVNVTCNLTSCGKCSWTTIVNWLNHFFMIYHDLGCFLLQSTVGMTHESKSSRKWYFSWYNMRLTIL